MLQGVLQGCNRECYKGVGVFEVVLQIGRGSVEKVLQMCGKQVLQSRGPWSL